MTVRGLADAGTELGLCARSELPTTLAVADPGPDGTGYHFHLDETATFRLPDHTAQVERFAAVYVGGVAAVVEPAAGAVAATARAGAARSLLVVDPNVREDRTIDPPTASRLLRELCSLAHVVKASDEDLARLWPDTDPDESGRRLAAEGRLVVLTRGAKGATAFAGDAEPVSVPAVPVEVVNTIGAGDAFMAGVVNWLTTHGVAGSGAVAGLSREQVTRMLEFAARVAASVCAQAGTEPTRPPDN
ncbi:PfkB family carbohydrate kinase [Streptomyces sp. NPDC059096]|uniref:PfkB family carbohydrate kinase n=1 Tax=Streptomyces sp. NPDC059096 TaxID=3346727 RepID=UPI0036898B32